MTGHKTKVECLKVCTDETGKTVLVPVQKFKTLNQRYRSKKRVRVKAIGIKC